LPTLFVVVEFVCVGVDHLHQGGNRLGVGAADASKRFQAKLPQLQRLIVIGDDADQCRCCIPRGGAHQRERFGGPFGLFCFVGLPVDDHLHQLRGNAAGRLADVAQGDRHVAPRDIVQRVVGQHRHQRFDRACSVRRARVKIDQPLPPPRKRHAAVLIRIRTPGRRALLRFAAHGAREQ